MRLAYLGTPSAATVPLQALVDAGHEIVIVVTQPDRRRGRGNATSPSPVKMAATELGIPVTHVVADVIGSGAELGVVVAFGQLIKKDVLDAVPMVNLHFSLLPRWRGAAPVERAILAGDTETGVCLMSLDPGLDTGPIYDCREIEIGEGETADELRERLVAVGVDLLVDSLARGLSPPRPQDGEPTYAAKISPDEMRLDLSLPAEVVLRTVRLGRSWTTFRGKRLGVVAARVVRTTDAGPQASLLTPTEPDSDWVVAAACAQGSALALDEVQPEGKRPQSSRDWINGVRPRPGERLGD